MKSMKRIRQLISLAAVVVLTMSAGPLFAQFPPCRNEIRPYSDTPCKFAETIDVSEFANEISQRRVLIGDPAEMRAIDGGSAGSGWRRTGLVLTMLPADYNQSYVKQLNDVCRFYAPSVNSHFYTSSAFECNLLKQPGTGWIFENVAFKADPPVDGICPAWSPHPVYRYYNNRAPFGDTSHRYALDRKLKTSLEAAGWIDEGIAFCALRWSEAPVATYKMTSNRERESMVCDKYLQPYSCVVVNGQAPLYRVIRLPDQICTTPTRSSFDERTGACTVEVHTGQATASDAEIATHSFVQFAEPDSYFGNYTGIYVNSRDANGGGGHATSISPIYQFSTQQPLLEGGFDRRVMPWKGLPKDIEVSFDIFVKTLLRRTGGHAIAHPSIELIDTKSRRSLYITLGTVSGEPQSDFSARDLATGKPIVSTLFRSDPAFGVRLSGDTLLCNSEIDFFGCIDNVLNRAFRFRLRPSDIASVLAKARQLDPALSANIADYAIDNFTFKAEVSGDAEIGLRLDNYKLELFVR